MSKRSTRHTKSDHQPIDAADDADAGDLTDADGAATPGADVDDTLTNGPDEQPPLCDCPALPSTHRHFPGGPEPAALGDSQR
jgi:hypothetical protein